MGPKVPSPRRRVCSGDLTYIVERVERRCDVVELVIEKMFRPQVRGIPVAHG
jgi:hypothetical protein